MTTRKRKRRSCWDVRLARARQARAAARRRNAGKLLACILFVLAFLSAPVTGFSVTPAAFARTRQSVVAPPLAPERLDHWASPYELGAPGALRPRVRSGHGRYGNRRLTLARLLKDLRRPAARREAADMLMARIPTGDAELREWVQGQLDDGSMSALVVWAQPGLAEPDVLLNWKEAARQQAEEEAALRELLTGTDGGGRGGGGDGSDGVPGSTSKPH